MSGLINPRMQFVNPEGKLTTSAVRALDQTITNVSVIERKVVEVERNVNIKNNTIVDLLNGADEVKIQIRYIYLLKDINDSGAWWMSRYDRIEQKLVIRTNTDYPQFENSQDAFDGKVIINWSE